MNVIYQHASCHMCAGYCTLHRLNREFDYIITSEGVHNHYIVIIIFAGIHFILECVTCLSYAYMGVILSKTLYAYEEILVV